MVLTLFASIIPLTVTNGGYDDRDLQPHLYTTAEAPSLLLKT